MFYRDGKPSQAETLARAEFYEQNCQGLGGFATEAAFTNMSDEQQSLEATPEQEWNPVVRSQHILWLLKRVA